MLNPLKKTIPSFTEPLQKYCYDNNYGNYSRAGKSLCPDSKGYFFWDWSHLTTAAHQSIASTVYQTLQNPSSVDSDLE
ncbi:MAG: hypothetical protein GY782_04425 [Gammaproteobacteria bacterium]|nr:hypothetical protein [Gammaproteobacteria bacterium]